MVTHTYQAVMQLCQQHPKQAEAQASFTLPYKCLFFLGMHLRHMEVPRPGLTLELQLRPTPQPQQHQI